MAPQGAVQSQLPKRKSEVHNDLRFVRADPTTGNESGSTLLLVAH